MSNSCKVLGVCAPLGVVGREGAVLRSSLLNSSSSKAVGKSGSACDAFWRTFGGLLISVSMWTKASIPAGEAMSNLITRDKFQMTVARSSDPKKRIL